MSTLAERLLQRPRVSWAATESFPELFTTLSALMEVLQTRRVRTGLSLLADPRSTPKCLCGKEYIKRFRPSGQPFACNESFACPSMAKDVREKKRSTCIKKYGGPAAQSSAQVRAKTIETCRKRYGTDNPAQGSSVKSKIKRTNLKRYGVDNPLKSDSIKDRIRTTNEERYGGPAPACSARVLRRMHETNMKRYGTKAPAQNAVVANSMRKTCIEKFGVDNPFKSAAIKDRIALVHLQRRGVDNPMKDPAVRRKIARTTRRNYGVDNAFASKEVQATIRATLNKKYGVDHPLQNKKIHKKFRSTMMRRFGVESAMHDPELFLKAQHASVQGRYVLKSIDFDGRTVRVQGYEEHALRYMVETRRVAPSRICVSTEGTVPSVLYELDGRVHTYYPDFIVDDKTIVEVKSAYTLYKARNELVKNQAKARACRRAGYAFILLLVEHDETLQVPRAWENASPEELPLLITQAR